MLSYNFGYKTQQQIVDEINDIKLSGPTFGFESHTAEYIAAAYAQDATTDMGADIDEDNINFHLDALEEAGATFDRYDALKMALCHIDE